MNTPLANTPLHLLQTTFGYAQFRDHQQAIVEHVIAGKDALVLMATGVGFYYIFFNVINTWFLANIFKLSESLAD